MSGGETVRVGMVLKALRRVCCADDYSERGWRSLSGGRTAAYGQAGVAPRCVRPARHHAAWRDLSGRAHALPVLHACFTRRLSHTCSTT
jgi:hypothetical protein